MKVQLMHVDNAPGRVLVGPKKLGNVSVRIISLRDGSGRIEKLDAATGSWLQAPESVTFSEVWSAPAVPPAHARKFREPAERIAPAGRGRRVR